MSLEEYCGNALVRAAVERKFAIIGEALVRLRREQPALQENISEPDVETRNRTPLTRPVVFEAEWELRFGPNNRFRVFYDVNHEHGEVNILAIGVKKRTRLLIGRKEVEL